MSIRTDKVSQLLKREIGKILEHNICDPDLGFVSIVDVKVTPDLRLAKVYFSVLGDRISKEKTKKVLEKAKGYIKKLLSERIRLKFMPDIQFCLDESIEYSLRIEKILEELNAQKNKQDNKRE